MVMTVLHVPHCACAVLCVEHTDCLQAAAGAPARRPPLVFVHGSYHGAWCWRENFMPYFAAAGYDTYAISLRGQGGSERGDLKARRLLFLCSCSHVPSSPKSLSSSSCTSSGLLCSVSESRLPAPSPNIPCKLLSRKPWGSSIYLDPVPGNPQEIKPPHPKTFNPVHSM